MRDRRFAAIVRTGLTLPKPAAPGRTWQPHTDAERHLLAQARELDSARRWLVEEVARLRQTLPGARVTCRIAPLLPRLTERELQVLVGAAVGESQAETAERLRLSVHTIKCHRRRIQRRFGARNFTHVVAITAAAGLITVDPAAGGEDR